MSDETRRIRGFDGIRAIAILLVFAHHALSWDTSPFRAWLFFCLSGFLIVRSLYKQRVKIEAGSQTIWQAMKRFYWHRSLRILPLYYAVLSLFALLSLFKTVGHYSGGEWLYYWTCLTNFYFGHVSVDWGGPFSHLWSLAIEEQFYLVAAPLFLFITARLAAFVCLGLIIIGLLCDSVGHLFHWQKITLCIDTMINFSFLAYGGLIGLAADRVKLPKPGLLAMLMLGGYLVMPFGLDALGIKDFLWLELSPFVAGTALLAIYQAQQSVLVSLLELWPLKSLGTISYGMYLFHNFIHVNWVLTLLNKTTGVIVVLPDWLSIVVDLCLTIAIAALSWVWFEKRLLRFRTVCDN